MDWKDIFVRAGKTGLQVAIAMALAIGLAELDVEAAKAIGFAALTAAVTVVHNMLGQWFGKPKSELSEPRP